jgi:hypothetical protein
MAASMRGFWIALILATSQFGGEVAFAQGVASTSPSVTSDPTAVQATTSPIFQLPECPLVTPELRRQVLAATNGAERCKIKCSGCGCKGGPGYRAPREPPGTKGQCVGYKNILSICGPPPHTLCHRECATIVAVCKAVQTVKKSKKGTKSGAESSPGFPSALPPSPQDTVQIGTPPLTTPP